MKEDLIKKFLKKDNIFAVIGASENSSKYGHKVYKDLKGAGYKVYPVNPNAEKVLSDETYDSLETLPAKPDVVDIVVPPEVSEKIVKQCDSLGIDQIWLQPGSESEEIIEYCKENGIEVIHDRCVMKERIRMD